MPAIHSGPAHTERCRWSTRFRALAGRVVLFAILFASTTCLEDDRVDVWQAQVRIGIVTSAKYTQCKQDAGFYLPIFGSPKETDLRRCEEAILAAPCPLEPGLPLFCLNLYGKAEGPRLPTRGGN